MHLVVVAVKGARDWLGSARATDDGGVGKLSQRGDFNEHGHGIESS